MRIPQISGYEIQEQLGKGAAGSVFKAINQKGISCAIKFLTLGFTGRSHFNPDQAMREIEAMKALNEVSTLVPRLLDYDLDATEPYLVLEFIGGETLEEIIHKNDISLRDRLDIIRNLAGTIDDAHRCNVIHRDIKPSNIKRDGSRTLLLDFGIAVSGSYGDGDLTTGTKGTFRYAAPESSNLASYDLFAFGIVAFELLFGVHPFFTREEARSTSLGDVSTLKSKLTAKLIRQDWRLPSRLGPDSVYFLTLLPELQPDEMRSALDEIFLGLFNEEDKRRYKNAIDFARALRKTISEPPQVDTTEAPVHHIELTQYVPGRNFPLIPVVTVLFLLVIGGGFFAFQLGAFNSPRILTTAETGIVFENTSMPAIVASDTVEPSQKFTAISSPGPVDDNISTATDNPTDVPSTIIVPTDAPASTTLLPDLTPTPMTAATPTTMPTNTVTVEVAIAAVDDTQFPPTIATDTTVPVRTDKATVLPTAEALATRTIAINASGYSVEFASVRIPAGCFVQDETEYCVQQAGWIDALPVSQSAYAQCVSDFTCGPLPSLDGTGAGALNRVQIDREFFLLAERFCTWRASKRGSIGGLATIEAWQYVAREVDGFELGLPEWLADGRILNDHDDSQDITFRCFEDR